MRRAWLQLSLSARQPTGYQPGRSDPYLVVPANASVANQSCFRYYLPWLMSTTATVVPSSPSCFKGVSTNVPSLSPHAHLKWPWRMPVGTRTLPAKLLFGGVSSFAVHPPFCGKASSRATGHRVSRTCRSTPLGQSTTVISLQRSTNLPAQPKWLSRSVPALL